MDFSNLSDEEKEALQFAVSFTCIELGARRQGEQTGYQTERRMNDHVSVLQRLAAR